MRTYLTRPFVRWAKQSRLSNEAILVAVMEIESGQIDADLGQGLLKNASQGRVRENEEGTGRLLPVVSIEYFSCTVFRRTPMEISGQMN